MNKQIITLISIVSGSLLFAQNTISGTISSSNKLTALSNVKIEEDSNPSNTVYSDADGNYKITMRDPNKQLVFYLESYNRFTTKVPANGILNVTLTENVKEISEVVMIGYGKAKKSDITGSVATVKTDDILDAPSNSIERALQGRVAGLQITNSSQNPGAGATVRIRGGSSLRGSNSPLVVVDGFPLGDAGDLKQINPADIESVDILKDASASAIYGSRGANGVMIVTTKMAKRNKMSINLNQQTTFTQFSSKLDLWRDPLLLAELNNEGRINGGLPALYVGAVSPSGIYYPSLAELQSGSWPYFTRWDDYTFKSLPISNNTTLSINSGTEKTSFNLSLNNFDDSGVYIDDGYKKYGYNARISHKISDKLQARFSNILTKTKTNFNRDLAYYRNPIFPVYNDAGGYFLIGTNDYEHPVALTDRRLNKQSTTDFITSAEIAWDILKELKLTTRLNYKYGESITDQYFPKVYTEAGNFNNGAAWINNFKDERIVSETFLNYDKTFGKHHIGVTAGYTYENYNARTSQLGAFDFVNETLLNENMSAGNPALNQVSNSLQRTELVSGIFRLNYAFNKKYLLTVTGRTDGSSKFGANNKWALFPSAAVSWKVDEEEFIKDWESLSQLKLRASYGLSGNQGINPYQTLSRYGIGKYFNNGNWVTSIGPGYVVGTTGQSGIEMLWGGIPNPDLKWETTAQSDFGVDLGLFNNRLTLTADYYKKDTKDLLRERILPLSSGYDRMWINDGRIQNEGIELTLNGVLVDNDDWNVNSTFIFSRNRNKVVDLGNSIQSGLLTDPNTGMQFEFFGNSLEQFRQYPNLLAIGQPVNVFYGYKVNGIVQTLQEGINAGLDGAMAQPGEFKYVDINGDGIVDVKDRTVIGDPNPDFSLSFNLGITYKNWDFGAFVYGSFGGDILNTQAFNQPSNTPLRWTPDNPTNDYPSLKEGRQLYLSDWWLEDGSFLRIQNVTLGYTIKPNDKIINKVRIYLNSNNLYTFTRFKGYDPEVESNGLYFGGYPRLRQVTFGLDITF